MAGGCRAQRREDTSQASTSCKQGRAPPAQTPLVVWRRVAASRGGRSSHLGCRVPEARMEAAGQDSRGPMCKLVQGLTCVRHRTGRRGIQVLPTTGPRLRKSRNCWTWQDWDLIYLRRQGTQAGKEVSEGLSGLASSASPGCTAHTSGLGLGSPSLSQSGDLAAGQ